MAGGNLSERRMGHDRGPVVLVVDDDKEALAGLTGMLSEDFQVDGFSGPTEALRGLEKEPADIIISSQNMTEMTGVEFLARTRNLVPGAKKIVLTSFAEVETVVSDFNRTNVDFFLTKPVDGNQLIQAVRKVWRDRQMDRNREDLIARNRELIGETEQNRDFLDAGSRERLDALIEVNRSLETNLVEAQERNRVLTLLNESLNLQATVDPLTGLHNRRELYHRLSVEWGRFRRHTRPLSLILLDIDHFKEVNDTYGHECGDSVLRTLSMIMHSSVRMHDSVFRYGGEEFVVQLPETPLVSACQVAENLRQRVARHTFYCGLNTLSIQISLGVSGVKEQTLDSEEALVKFADQGMYRAKETGRNRTIALSGQDSEKTLFNSAD